MKALNPKRLGIGMIYLVLSIPNTMSYGECDLGPLRPTAPTSYLEEAVHPSPSTAFLSKSASMDSKRLWSLPVISSLLAFWSFPYVSLTFHAIVQWATENTWIPESDAQLNLQTNVVTQVVNGPVITSISVLFATLTSMTFSTLYSRQRQIQESYFKEHIALRQLEQLVHNHFTSKALPRLACEEVRTLTNEHRRLITSEVERPKSVRYSESSSSLLSMLDCCTNILSNQRRQDHRVEALVLQMSSIVNQMMELWMQRYLSVNSNSFPTVHFLTLGLLAFSIAVSFLVATDEAEFIFLHGLPVRLLWTLLVSSFTALSVVCYDLSTAYAGEYHV